MGLIERIGSDYAYLTGVLRSLSKITKVAKNPNRTYPQVVRQLAETFGDRVALISERERMSYRDYDRRGDQYARWAMAHGVTKGDVVALMMPNRPEFLAVWLGITRAGGVVALLNTNLSGVALAHCVNIVKAKHIIVDTAAMASFRTAETHLEAGPLLWCHGASQEGYERIDTKIDALPNGPIAESDLPRLTIEDRCLYVYTSGTTGLPKAANINHYRVQGIMAGFTGAMKMRPQDRIYVCLPMYHTSGGVLGPGAALMAGASVVLREKFSASLFWEDIAKYECTVFLYIGELCRYLLNSPPHPRETTHKIRLACGNGLRPDIWADFQKRFRIPKILEWYAATEGNCVFLNFDGKIGAVGRIPGWMKSKFFVEIVRFDIDTEQPVRGPDGFCVKCEPGEVGEAISKIINDPKRPSQRFEGYADPGATDKKILRDAFEKGDRWFRTGDLMRNDAVGYYYFVDRIGDTFRWKGENVATSEVSEAITAFPGIREANVYGVRVPGAEGRVGMAALSADGTFDIDAFGAHVAGRLAAYARPVFLRMMGQIDATSTFKQRKVDLVKQGFDPAATTDAIFFLHPELQTYVRLTPSLYGDISTGKVQSLSDGRDLGLADVIAFWSDAGAEKWFKKNADFDRAIADRFGALHARAAAGQIDAWTKSPDGVLALILVLDQFSRNMFRGDARAFAQDELASGLARRAAIARTDLSIEPELRAFLFMPLMHSESIVDQELSVLIFHAAAPHNLRYAREHERIIRRFGRFPHRNPALGRHMTAAEQAFIDGGGFAG